jgi:hypothetical protein
MEAEQQPILELNAQTAAEAAAREAQRLALNEEFQRRPTQWRRQRGRAHPSGGDAPACAQGEGGAAGARRQGCEGGQDDDEAGQPTASSILGSNPNVLHWDHG